MCHTPDAAINVRVAVIPREGESQALKNTPLLHREREGATEVPDKIALM
jgi:hypothetical protein